MTPRNRIDAMELYLAYVAASLEVSLFGSLVKKNRGTIAKIAQLVKVKKTYEAEAIKLGFDGAKLSHEASLLQAQLQASGNDRQPSGGDLNEFVKLSIIVPLLTGPDVLIFSPLFLFDKTGINRARDAISKTVSQLAKLLSRVSLLMKLWRMGYTSVDQRWLSLPAFAEAFSAVRAGEMRSSADAAETLVQEYDHCRMELKRASIRIDEIAKLNSRCDGLRVKVASYVKLYVWWADLSAVTGRAGDDWDNKATALVHSMFHEAAESDLSRVFPWTSSSDGPSRLPRWLLLKSFEVDDELARSVEQRDKFSPYALARSLKYFDLYVRNAECVLSKTGATIAEKVAVIQRGDAVETSAAAAEMHPLLYRRAYLSRRLGELRERQLQGREAVANWYAKGKPIDLGVADASIAGSAAAAAYVEEEDVLGDTVLAAGAADRAADAQLAEVEPPADEDSDSESDSGSDQEPE